MTIKEAYAKITGSADLKNKAVEAVKTGTFDKFLKENGIDVSADQIKEYLLKVKNGELNREELNMAAGGCSDNCEQGIWSGITLGIGCIVSGMIQSTDDMICEP